MRNSTIDVQPLTGGVGAEISGVDLAAAPPEQIYDELRQALVEHGVIFFRDQDLSSEQYTAFGRRFGELTTSSVVPGIAGYPEIAEVRKERDQRNNVGGGWHTDQSFRAHPIMGTVLLAREIPPHGGDTMFISMAKAYDALSAGLKQTLAPLRAAHSHARIFGPGAQVIHGQDDRNLINTKRTDFDEAVHPVVINHPESGRPILYINPTYTYRFEGWTEDESRPLLEYLFRHAQRPEFSCRFRWQEGSLAFWDNRQTWHYAVNDYHGERRLMHRLMIADRPRHAGGAIDAAAGRPL